MKLSTCLVLKNEAKTIWKALDSVKTFTDEYIIGIDSKTSDNTREEVEKFFNDNPNIVKQVYEFEWKDSFAQARNEGMDKATGDYILILDGHEFIPDVFFNISENREIPIHKIMPTVLEQIEKNEADESFFHLYQQPWVGNIPNNYFLQPRIYRNGIGKDGKNKMRFGRAAHNVIRNSDPETAMQFPEVIICHDAPEDNRAERAEQRGKMNVIELKKDLKKNPNDTRALFYLGNTYMEIAEHENAIETFLRYLAVDLPDTSEVYQVHFHLALEYKAIGDTKNSLIQLHNALRVNPERRDTYIVIGDIYNDKKKYERALHYYNQALAIEPTLSRMFQNGSIQTWAPYQRAAYVYAELGNTEKAVAYLRRAMRYVQCEEWNELIDKWTNKKPNVLVIDGIGSFTKDFIQYLSKKYNVNVCKHYDRYLGEWADVIWQEWGDQNLIDNLMPEKTVVRIHGYEAYTNVGLLQQVDLTRFKKVVFVAEHIRDMFPEPVQDNSVVIYNGVDTEKFFIKEHKRKPNSVGIAGYLNVKKNPMRLAKYIVNNPNLVFNLRIEWQDPFLKKAFEYETKDCKNIVYHGRYDDLNDFWNQCKYVISTSDIESFSYNVAEAMSAGCHPMIYPWMGSDRIWHPDSFIKGDKLKLTTKKTMEEERDYILDNYPLSMSLLQMEQVLVSKGDDNE